MTRAVAFIVAVGGNDNVVDDEVMLSEEVGVLRVSDGSEGGSSDGRLGVGSTVGGGGSSVMSPVAVVIS